MTQPPGVEVRNPRQYSLVANGRLFPRAPFHFDGTFFKQSHFPNRLDHWTPGLFYQTIRIDNMLLGVKCRDTSQGREPSIELSVYYPSPIQDSVVSKTLDEIAFRYDLHADLAEFQALADRDTTFTDVFKRWKGMRASTQYSLYELLVVGLVLQNTQVRRSVQMLETLTQRFGTLVEFDGVELWSIWLPEDLSAVDEEELRALKIGYRARSLKRFSEQFSSGLIDEVELRRLDDDSLKRELLKIYGVGPETVRIIMSEAFHRPGVFAHIAPWQQKIYSRLFYNQEIVPTERIIDDINRQFGRYSALAVHYIWEDVFWRRRNEYIDWLEAEIRL